MRAERPASRRQLLFSVFHGKARAEDVLQKGLEQGWHGSVPEREQKDPMLRPAHVITWLYESWRQLAGLKIRLRSQQSKIELSDLDKSNLVPHDVAPSA
jgi:hypothetical protein